MKIIKSALDIIHTWHPWKLTKFQDRPPPCPSSSKILRPPWRWPFILSKFPPPSPNYNHSIKRKHNPRVNIRNRTFLQAGFHFQNQLINLVWLSFDFLSFSWSLTICYFVALYSCVCSCKICSIIHIFSSLSCLIVFNKKKKVWMSKTLANPPPHPIRPITSHFRLTPIFQPLLKWTSALTL